MGGIVVSHDDTVVVAGSFQGTAYFPTGRPPPDDSIAVKSQGNLDVFLAALNADDSTFAWVQSVPGASYDSLSDVAGDDSVVISGEMYDTLHFPTGKRLQMTR